MERHLSFHQNRITSHGWGMGCSRLMGAFLIVGLPWSLPAWAGDDAIPWECSGFSGEAQARCMRTFSELQQEKIAKLERQLEAQRQRVDRLERQMSQQATQAAHLQKKLSKKRYRRYRYGWPRAWLYSPLGFSLQFGPHGVWAGPRFFGGPFGYGYNFYGHRYGKRRWHRH